MFVAGYQLWRSLLFVHWEVDAAALERALPPGVELDTFEGRAFLGLVPFAMVGVRPRGLPPVPTAHAFPETNLRTYVKARATGEPGVFFFSLDAASSLAVAATRLLTPLRYFRARMMVRAEADRVAYRSRRFWPRPTHANVDVVAEVGRELGVAELGTLEHFLVERYVLFAQNDARARSMMRIRIQHHPYELHEARVTRLHETVAEAAGIPHRDAPDHVCFSPGVDVEIGFPERVPVHAAARAGDQGAYAAPRESSTHEMSNEVRP